MLIGSRRSVRRVTNGNSPSISRRGVETQPPDPKVLSRHLSGSRDSHFAQRFQGQPPGVASRISQGGRTWRLHAPGKQPEYPSERFSVIKWSIILFCSVWVRRPHPLTLLLICLPASAQPATVLSMLMSLLICSPPRPHVIVNRFRTEVAKSDLSLIRSGGYCPSDLCYAYLLPGFECATCSALLQGGPRGAASRWIHGEEDEIRRVRLRPPRFGHGRGDCSARTTFRGSRYKVLLPHAVQHHGTGPL